MEKHFWQVDQHVVRVSSIGKGAPVVLLHASPSSGKMLYPLMHALANTHLAIAPDIPGCGASQPLVIPFQEISEYVHFFKKLFDEMGLQKMALYGTATGAQIAIRYALEYPEQVSQLYLDNTADFLEAEQKKVLQNYFPDLRPQFDGSHLPKLWTLVRDLFVFFPWSWQQPEQRLQSDFPTAAVLQMVALDFLQAGAEYDRAYRAAFVHEKAAYVQALKVPTTIFKWEASIVLPYIERLLVADMPEQIEVVITEADRGARIAGMRQQIAKTYEGAAVVLNQAKEETKGSFYFPLPQGGLEGKQNLEGSGIPLLVLHEERSSAEVAYHLVNDLLGKHPIVAVSLPGHGGSAAWSEYPDVKTLAPLLHRLMLKKCGVPYAFIDFENSDALRTELEGQGAVKAFDFPINKKAKLPEIEAAEYGQHLLFAWYYLRDRELFSDPTNKRKENILLKSPNLDPAYLQMQLLAWMQCRV